MKNSKAPGTDFFTSDFIKNARKIAPEKLSTKQELLKRKTNDELEYEKQYHFVQQLDKDTFG